MGASVVISAVFLIFGKYVYQMFTTDATVIEIGMHMMTLMAPAYAVYVFIEVYSGALRGTGDVLVPMLMTCGGVSYSECCGFGSSFRSSRSSTPSFTAIQSRGR